MRNTRLLMSLACVLIGGSVACGGVDEGVDDFTESLKRGKKADGGAFVAGDRDRDSDEASDEASDGGKRHRHGDRDFDGDHGDGGDCDRGERGDSDRDDDSDDRDGRGGLNGPKLDGGSKRDDGKDSKGGKDGKGGFGGGADGGISKR